MYRMLVDDSRIRCGLLVLLVAAVYAGTIGHGFVWDDNLIIVYNPMLAKTGNIARLFLSEDTAMGFTGYYRPVTYLSFLLERALWGVNPLGYHVTNLALHLLAVYLFHAVVLKLFRKERLALICALIFALHPIAAETVNFLAGGRNTLLCAVFTLLSLLCYLKKRIWLSVAAFGVALFCKEFALLLPAVFLVCHFQSRKRLSPASLLPFLVAGAGYLALRSAAVHKANFLSAINLSDAALAPYLVVRYLANMIAPYHLRVLYDLHPNAVDEALCALLIVCAGGALYFLRKRPEAIFAACWMLLFLLPVINIIPLESSSLMADRYAYFSLMGFAILAGSMASGMTGRAATAGLAVVTLLFVCIDLKLNGSWHDEESFYTRMCRDAPEKFDGYQNLGMYYYRKGDVARALPQLSAALSKEVVPAPFLIGSASVFWKEGRPEVAEKALLRALRLEPGNPEIYLMLVPLYERNGDERSSRFYRERGGMIFRGFDGMLASRAALLCREGERYLSAKLPFAAENVLWQALMNDPAYVPALVGMGRAKAGQGNLSEAEQYLMRALVLDPDNGQSRYYLALVRQRQDEGASPAAR